MAKLFQKPKQLFIPHFPFLNNGFTFIEIMVVLGITVLLAGIAVTYSQKSRQIILLNSEKVKIAESISKTKALAITGYTKPLSLPPPSAYGFEVNYGSSSFAIFSINANPLTFSCTDPTKLYIDGYPQKIDRNINLPLPLADGLLCVIFIPPNLDTRMFNRFNSEVNSSLKINLEAKASPSISGTITVSQNGYLSF